MLGHHTVLVGLVLLVAAVSASGSAQGSDHAVLATKSIAAANTPDFRVEVVAQRRAGSGGAPTAAVTATISKRTGGRWRVTATHRLRSTYFWHTVTGPLAVCGLELATTRGRPGFRPYVAVQLLQSPSLGCGKVHRFSLG
jgi:hypothetical protein